MNEAKHSCIEAYLSEHFPDSKIEQNHDFDLRAQSFKVHVPGDSLLLKVSDDFVRYNDEASLVASFRRWDVAALLKANSERIVLITSEGALFRGRQ